MINDKEKVLFRFSNSDICAYLTMIGYTIEKIEIIFDKRHNRLKAFVYFKGHKDDFLDIQSKFNNRNLIIDDLFNYSKHRQNINKLIKIKINEYENVNGGLRPRP